MSYRYGSLRPGFVPEDVTPGFDVVHAVRGPVWFFQSGFAYFRTSTSTAGSFLGSQVYWSNPPNKGKNAYIPMVRKLDK